MAKSKMSEATYNAEVQISWSIFP